ncbi:MAG: YceI family protein, partial [Bacteroidia bacterium]
MKFKSKIILLAGLFAIASGFTIKVTADKFMTKNGKVTFFSHTDMEDIKADNNKVSSVLDTKTGKMAIEVLIKSFVFKKALMEEHFNENYMESTKFPKAKFDGKIDDLKTLNFAKDGTYKSTVSGNLTMKDKTNAVKTTGTFTVKDGKVNGKATFKVKPADYNIVIPAVVKEKIAKEVEITVDLDY